jgi:hypothetical protein
MLLKNLRNLLSAYRRRGSVFARNGRADYVRWSLRSTPIGADSLLDRILSYRPLPKTQLQFPILLRRTDVEDFLWNRTTGDLPHELGITIVDGHTPSNDLQVRWNSPFSIGIDTGAVYGGKLTAIRLDHTPRPSKFG